MKFKAGETIKGKLSTTDNYRITSGLALEYLDDKLFRIVSAQKCLTINGFSCNRYYCIAHSDCTIEAVNSLDELLKKCVDQNRENVYRAEIICKNVDYKVSWALLRGECNKLSRADFAEYLSMAMETLIRTLSSMQDKKLINIKKGEIEIIDYKGLRRIIGINE